MPRAAIVACVAVVLACLGWLFLSQDNGPPPLPAASAAVTGDVREPAKEAVAAVDGATKPATNAAERADATAAAPASEQPPLPADATWVDVRIVDRATQQPVAGADVAWSGDDQWALINKLPHAERDALLRDQDAIIARFGWRTRSDERGNARVTLGRSGARVAARAGTRWGETWLPRNAEPAADGRTVQIAEDLTLRVRVTDHAGRVAAGVPVVLEDVGADGKVNDRVFGGDTPTGADGIAVFPHVQSRQVSRWGPSRGSPVAQWRVGVAIHGLDAPRVLVDAQAPPAEPVDVTLPPTGRLLLRFTFEGKPPRPGLDNVRIHAGPKDDSDATNRAWTRPVDDDGVARYAYAPLDKTFFVFSQDGGGSFWNFEVQGPRVADQEVTAAIELATEVHALSGRLLQADGSPLADQPVGASFDFVGMSGGASVTTDAGGRFLWLLGRKASDPTREWKIKRLIFERREEGASPQRVVVPPRDLALGRNDLGDLRLGVEALVVGGRFVFDGGAPRQPQFGIQRHSVRQTRSGPTEQWNGVDALQIDGREDGTFEVRGRVEAGRYRIAVHAYDHLPVAPVEFVPGARDVEITVRRGASLSASCRLPDGVKSQQVQLDLVAAGATPAPRTDNDSERGFPFGRDGGGGSLRAQPDWTDTGPIAKYRWPAIEPGTYTLKIGTGGFATPLVTIADVVAPPPAGGDPRLHEIDLTAAIGTLRLRVNVPQSTDARRSGATMAVPQPQLDEQSWQAIALVDGEENVVPVPKQPVDLLLVRSGCRPVTLRAASGSVEATLEAWPRIEVRFTGVDALPPGAILRVLVRDPAADGKRAPRISSDRFGGSADGLLQPDSFPVPVEDGVAALQCGDTPRRLFVMLQLAERGRSRTLKQVAPNEITAGSGTVTVALSADEIRAAIDELKQPPPDKK